MKIKQSKIITGLICVAMLCMLTQLAIAAEVSRITKEELKAKIGSSDHNIVIVDVRSGKDWKGGEFKIKGAVREDPSKVSEWMGKYSKSQMLLFYCT